MVNYHCEVRENLAVNERGCPIDCHHRSFFVFGISCCRDFAWASASLFFGIKWLSRIVVAHHDTDARAVSWDNSKMLKSRPDTNVKPARITDIPDLPRRFPNTPIISFPYSQWSEKEIIIRWWLFITASQQPLNIFLKDTYQISTLKIQWHVHLIENEIQWYGWKSWVRCFLSRADDAYWYIPFRLQHFVESSPSPWQRRMRML